MSPAADLRKRRGVVYTPEPIAGFLAEQGLAGMTGPLRVVDPACGDGALLLAAARVLGRHRSPDEVAASLYGVDIDPDSAELTRRRLAGHLGLEPSVFEARIRSFDSLGVDAPAPGATTCWADEFPDAFEGGGFDLVLGNPPYVRMEQLADRRDWLRATFSVAAERADLYAYFFEVGQRLLHEGGRLTYLSSSTFFRTAAGLPLRRFLQERMSLEAVLDFGDAQVFDGVTTYPAIVVARKGTRHDDVAALTLDGPLPSELSAHFARHHHRCPQPSLSGWTFERAEAQALRTKLTEGHPTLQDVYGPPLYGIKTGCNDAFVVDVETRERLLAADPRSDELLRPFVGGRDLRRWRAQPRRWLIYIPRNAVDIDAYPAIRAHLLPFRDRLERRATKQRWYELQQAQRAYAAAFDAPKISYPHVCAGPRFHLDRLGLYGNDKTWALPTDDPFALALLNSRVFWFLIRGLCPRKRGGHRELRRQHIARLPIPDASPSERAELGRLALHCQARSEADDPASSAAEATLDARVNALFSLTPAEIDLLET